MIFCKRCGNYAASGLEDCPKCGVSFSDSGHPSLVGGLVKPARSSATASGPGVEPAGHVQRLVAYLIDGLLMSLIVGLGYIAFLFIPIAPVFLKLLAGALALGYEPYFIAAKGATPGKSAMDLRVVGRDGGQIGPVRSVLRFLLKYILGSVLWLVALFTARRQCLHDLIVGTYVVRA